MTQHPRISPNRYRPPIRCLAQCTAALEPRPDAPTDAVGTHSCVGRTSDSIASAEPASPLAGQSGPARLARLLRTALQPGQTLGSAEITHPFHPLRGQRFAVLMIRKISGVERLSLRHAEGSFAVRRDWTDWAPPGSPTEAANNNPPLLIDASGLLALSELVLSLNRNKMRA